MTGTPVTIYGPNGQPLHTEEYTAYGSQRVLAVTSMGKSHSVYMLKSWTGQAANQLIVAPVNDGTLEIFDIVVSASKKTGGTVTVQFNDGEDADVLFYGSVDDAALNIAVPFQGRVEGWANAYLEYTTAGAAFGGSVLITYVKKIIKGPTYAEWIARR